MVQFMCVILNKSLGLSQHVNNKLIDDLSIVTIYHPIDFLIFSYIIKICKMFQIKLSFATYLFVGYLLVL